MSDRTAQYLDWQLELQRFMGVLIKTLEGIKESAVLYRDAIESRVHDAEDAMMNKVCVSNLTDIIKFADVNLESIKGEIPPDFIRRPSVQ